MSLHYFVRNRKDASTRDLIIEILLAQYPLSIAEITRLIRSRFNLKLTYQAVRKAVNTMLRDGLVLRNVEDGKYHIDRHWLVNAKAKLDRALMSYDRSRQSTLSQPSQDSE